MSNRKLSLNNLNSPIFYNIPANHQGYEDACIFLTQFLLYCISYETNIIDNKYCTLQKFKKINLWFTGPLSFEDSYTALTVHVTKCTVLIIAHWKILSDTDAKTNYSIRVPLYWIAILVEKKKCICLKKVMLNRNQSLLQLDHVILNFLFAKKRKMHLVDAITAWFS